MELKVFHRAQCRSHHSQSLRRLSKQKCMCLYFLVDDHREATYGCEVASNKRAPPAKREELLD